MEKCVIDLLAAISQIESTYISIIGYNSNDLRYQQAAENAFTAELYHQYKSIIVNDKTDYYNNLQLHYDLTKMRFDGRRPDLVLHKSPDSRDIQKLYIEIKTSASTNNYISDFEKILLATEPNNGETHLGFVNASFISVKTNIESVYQKIREFKVNKQLPNSRYENIYSIHLLENNTIEIKKFSEII